MDDDKSPSPIGVVLYDPDMKVIWQSRPSSSEGSFRFPTSTTTGRRAQSAHLVGLKYQLCIQNGNLGADDYIGEQDGLDREVGFALRVSTPRRYLEDSEAGPDDVLTAHLVEMTRELMEGLETMTDHQEYVREREARHLDLSQSTFRRIVQWTVVEAGVLILIAGGQVYYLRKFFEQKRYL